ncbi:ferredoxin--NADP reductase [Allorhizocola rhizosphaerae]|uniref:ferredoxin--NADP reductase n=1 Tax=Allorhizocola rhizosphaerae TaxID=1872709 RepID=UPI000E3C53EF|nr:ferredoxin--NADP reductase [Allorhizocola rhizosphaerae]
MTEHVRVVEVVRETADAHSLVLELPDGWAYQPGQFMTVRAGDVARSYSFSSSPLTGEPPRITVKRAGRGSNWICDHVTPGSTLECLPPGGVFVPSSLDRDLLLIAGGSGITPVMSILKSALHAGSGRVALVYANRDASSVIFGDELASLACDRLTVVHWLDSDSGMLSVDRLRDLIEPYRDHETFVCGPEAFMDLAEQAVGTGVHTERFVSMDDNPFERTASERESVVQVTIGGQTVRLPWPANTRLLDVLLDHGFIAPSSCRQGNCGTCAVRKTAGEVEMVNNEVLEEEDFAEGYILACQALPVTDEVIVTYE